MNKPLIYSASLHVTVIALMILGMPPSDRKLEIPDSIPVELVNLGDVSEAARVDVGEESPDPPAPPTPSVKPTPPQPPAPPPPAAKVEPPPPPPPKAPEPPKVAQLPPAPREPQPPPPPPPPTPTPPPPKPPEPPKPEPPKPTPTPEPVPKVEPPKPEPKKPEPPKPEPPKPEPPKPEPKKPEPPKPEPARPEPPKAEPKKPEPPKQETRKPAPTEDPLAKLLGDYAKAKPTTAPSAAPSNAQSSSSAASSSKPSGAKTASQGPEREFKPSGKATDAIRSQLSKLWNVDTGRRNDGDMKVIIHVEVGPDGSVLNARMDDSSLARASSDRTYRASAEAAVRAILRAQKLNLLPDEFTPATYQNWRKFVFTFDPRDMF